jgi:hypothetical protein
MPRSELLARLLRRGEYTITLDGGVERRARLAHDRMLREWERANRGEPGELDPLTFEECLSNLVEAGLEADEATHGLAGSIFGEVMSADVMGEGRRRRRLVRHLVAQCRCDPFDCGPYGHDDTCPAAAVTQASTTGRSGQERLR